MGGERASRPSEGRRKFLSQVSLAAAGSALAMKGAGRADAAPPDPAPMLPVIRLGEHQVTRLVAGWNPIGGYSYMGPTMDRHMQEYFTPERIVQFLEKCEREGINTHQFSRPEMMADILRAARQRGSKMKFICLYADAPHKPTVKEVVRQTQPIAVVHHGGVTDRLFREGKSGQVRDFVKRVHDAGVLAGVSAHNPENVKRVADEDWENDFFMTCFYHMTRTPEEIKTMPPVVTVPVGKPFFISDPATMTAVMRRIEKPCLGFKILAAGRMGYHEHLVRDAFQFAFENIKPIDGVIVGMYPRFRDEVRENAEHVRRFAQAPAA